MSYPPAPFGSSSVLENAAGLFTAGPAPGIPVIKQSPHDGSLLVFPSKFFGYGWDDATWINYALTLVSAPGTAGYFGTRTPTRVRLVNGLQFNTLSTIGGNTLAGGSWSYGTVLDLNDAIINFNGTGFAIDLTGPHQSYPNAYNAGGVINGSVANAGGSSPSGGVRYGGGSDFRIGGERGLRISGFNQTGQTACMESNINGFTEKTRLEIETFDSTTGFTVDSPSGTFNSHEYNMWHVHASCNQHQTGMRMLNTSFLSGGELVLWGNGFVGGASADGNSWLNLTDTGSGGNVAIARSHVRLQAETTNAGTYTWATILFGSGGNMLNCYGMLRFTGNNWTPSDLAAGGQLTFGGPIRDPTTGTPLTTFNAAPEGWV